MNKQGHSQTLVAAHPGNRNAIKSGVFSPATLAPRVYDVEQAIAEQPPEEVVVGLLRRELAALAVLGEAMDQALSTDGLYGRSRDPRTLISLRLRLNEKLRRTIEQYERAIASAVAAGAAQDRLPEIGQSARGGDLEPLIETIASVHDRPSIGAILPQEFDPENFLGGVITSSDPGVKIRDRLEARRLLTSRRMKRPPTCLCFSTLVARNELELRDWIDEIREAGGEPNMLDARFAALVRRIVGGEEFDRGFVIRETTAAIEQVVTEGADRARGDGLREDGRRTRDHDPAVRPFWEIALSPDPRVSAKERLQAFRELDKIGALPQCTCNPKPVSQLVEHEADRWCAYTIRLVAKKHYRAALHIAQYPETFIAVRDAIDAIVVIQIEALGGEDAGRTMAS